MLLPAPAKLNLALAVAPPEPPSSSKPGWHRIASWFVPITLADELSLTPLPHGSTSTHTIVWADDAPRPSPIDWPIHADLAVRAHRLLEAHLARPLPIALTLRKRIPVGGGLGGGSSNAASTLLGLNSLFNLHLPTPTLARLGGTLGSDVPFFIDLAPPLPPRPALVTAFGDAIERLPAPPASSASSAQTAPTQVSLIFPPFGCPTPAVYRAFDAAPTQVLRDADVRALTALGPLAADAHLFNDLLPAARAAEPRLATLLTALAAALPPGRHLHMTGSGSTLFTLGPPLPALSALATTLGAAVAHTLIPAAPSAP